MGQFLLLLAVALTVGAVVFGVTVLLTGGDHGLSTAEPDGRAVPLPGTRPLVESDITALRFDTALRGYRMAQVDQALRRAAYDIGYKDELIGVLEAEVAALRSGRMADAEVLRRAREAAQAATGRGELTDESVDEATPVDELTPVDEPTTEGEAPLGERLDERPDEPAATTVVTEAAVAEETEPAKESADAAPPKAAEGGDQPESDPVVPSRR